MSVDVLIPPLGTTTDTLILIEWFRKEGDAVVKDEPLFSVETDKATLENPARGLRRTRGRGGGAEPRGGAGGARRGVGGRTGRALPG